MFQEFPIGKLVVQCKNWSPKKDGSGTFDYIDISSIDNVAKEIATVEKYLCEDAPSRARQLVKAGDVLVSTVRPNLNGVALVEKKHDGMTASTGYCVLRPKQEKLDSAFLFHWVKTDTFVERMINVATGASYPAVSDTKVKASTIPLPPLEHQKRIVNILDAADALRAKRLESLTQLDNLLQSTFLDMFGDPVTNPKGWRMKKFEDFVERLDGGKNVSQAEYETNYKILRVSAVTQGIYRPSESKFLPEDFEVPESYLVNAGDLLISRANTTELVGATAYVWETPPNIVLPDKIWKFVWKSEYEVEPLFIFQLSQQTGFRNEIGRLASGTSGSMKNVSKAKLLGLSVPLPPYDLQRCFAEIVKSIEAQKARLRAHLEELDKLFGSLQQRAFNGEL